MDGETLVEPPPERLLVSADVEQREEWMHTLCRSSTLAAIVVAAAFAVTGCDEGRRPVSVFAADALAASLRDVERVFEEQHPDVDVRLEVMGSVMATRLVQPRRGDVLAVADCRLIEQVLSEGRAGWAAKFASTEIVLAGHTSSAHRAEITADNWYDILLKPDVRFGIADPSQDPCGYYTRVSWELAQKHYFGSRGSPRPLARELQDRCRPEFVALDAKELVSAYLNMARVDYAFVHKAQAIDLKLPFTPLRKEVNLGDLALEDYYGTVQVSVPNYRGGTETLAGSSIALGITLIKDAANPSDAKEFIRFVLSPEAHRILKVSGFQPIAPATIPAWGKVPEFLAGLVVPER